MLIAIICRQDASVGIATAYGLDARSSIPGRCKSFFSTAQRAADRSPLSSAEIKNGGVMPHSPKTSSWRGGSYLSTEATTPS
jgi:hypothetical protein